MEPKVDLTLVCVRESEGEAGGWRAFLTDDDQATVYCPECAEREFGLSTQ
jgi:hypothetical protein